MNSSLLALLELAASTTSSEPSEDVSNATLNPEIVAPLMRYEMLFKQKIEDEIRAHINSVTKTDLLMAKDAYTKQYLMSLAIPYDGIQQLCQELLKLCSTLGVSAPDVWQNFADGVFDWENDIEYMESL